MAKPSSAMLRVALNENRTQEDLAAYLRIEGTSYHYALRDHPEGLDPEFYLTFLLEPYPEITATIRPTHLELYCPEKGIIDWDTYRECLQLKNLDEQLIGLITQATLSKTLK